MKNLITIIFITLSINVFSQVSIVITECADGIQTSVTATDPLQDGTSELTFTLTEDAVAITTGKAAVLNFYRESIPATVIYSVSTTNVANAISDWTGYDATYFPTAEQTVLDTITINKKVAARGLGWVGIAKNDAWLVELVVASSTDNTMGTIPVVNTTIHNPKAFTQLTSSGGQDTYDEYTLAFQTDTSMWVNPDSSISGNVIQVSTCAFEQTISGADTFYNFITDEPAVVRGFITEDAEQTLIDGLIPPEGQSFIMGGVGVTNTAILSGIGVAGYAGTFTMYSQGNNVNQKDKQRGGFSVLRVVGGMAIQEVKLRFYCDGDLYTAYSFNTRCIYNEYTSECY